MFLKDKKFKKKLKIGYEATYNISSEERLKPILHKWPKSAQPQMSIKFSPKCIHNMCFSEINTVSQHVYLIPHSGSTKSGNEKH
jgi:hypothetical protein